MSLPVSDGVWDGLIDFLEHEKKEDIGWYAFNVYSMRILAAHKVEVTKDGIIITDDPPEKLDVTTPPRPIRKKLK